MRELLETYSDVAWPITPSLEERGGKASTRYLDRSPQDLWFQGSYRQLEAALQALRAGHAHVYWHVSQRYLVAPSKRGFGCPVCRRETDRPCWHKPGEQARLERFGPTDISVRRVHKGVSPALVEAGLDLLVEWFRSEGVSVFLPRELFGALAA